ncbi:hypothetical protein G6514_009309 [Epicoccum nigrum]|nr:hypothetical protein G6514_009309 [Epicoccum nigrum]
MAPRNDPFDLMHVREVRQLIKIYEINAPELLRLIARYEQLDADIDEFARLQHDRNLAFYNEATGRYYDVDHRRVPVYVRILRNKLAAVAGELVLVGMKYEDESEKKKKMMLEAEPKKKVMKGKVDFYS